MNIKKTVFVVVASIVATGWFGLTPNAYGDSDPQTVAFLQGFWSDAWGLTFVEGQSGMLLQDTVPGSFDLLVTDTTVPSAYVAQGTYIEATRLALNSMAPTSEELSQAGLTSFDYFVTAGVANGSNAFQAYVFGLAVVVVRPGLNPDDPAITIHGFTPLGVTPTLSDAVSAAHALWLLMNRRPDAATPVPVPPTPTDHCVYANPLPELLKRMGDGPTQPHNCEQACRECKAAAWERSQARRDHITAGGLACVAGGGLGCIAAGPGYPICVAAWGSACIAGQTFELSAEEHNYNADLIDCDQKKRECQDAHK